MPFNISLTQAATIAREVGLPRLFDDNDAPIDTQPNEEEGGLLGKLKGWVAGAVGAVGKFIKGIFKGDWSLSSVIRKAAGWLVSATSFIFNFNWNISPAQIEEQMKGHLTNLSGLFGEAVGGTLGWVTCGMGSAALAGVINPVAAATAMSAVKEEMREEVFSYWGAFANAALRAGIQTAFLYSYAAARRVVLKLLGQDERLKQIESGKAKPWSINQALDDWIESFEDKGLLGKLFSNFLEGLKDEFFDSCSEAFLVVADSFADALEAQGLAEQRRNPYRLIEVSYRNEEQATT